MRWRPFPVTLFDCDSTLTAVEGIDELPADTATQAEVASLTESAMDGQVALEDVYGRRLALLNPTRAQIRDVKSRYKAAAVPDAKQTIAALNHAGTEPWIISGGLKEAVSEFATWLGVSPDNVRAVDTEFDPLTGDWWQGETDPCYADHEHGHLTTTAGKADVIRAAVKTPGRRLLIGDGVSDLAASTDVDLFAAYAGVVSRPTVTDHAPVVITSSSIAPVLALALGPERVAELADSGGPHSPVASTCMSEIESGALHFNDTALARRFGSAA